MADGPIIIYSPRARYDSRTNFVAPLIAPFLRGAAIMGVEWTTLKFIEDAPLSVRVATFLVALALLAVLQQKDWLNFKGKWYFPISVCSLLFIYFAVVIFAYWNFSAPPIHVRSPHQETIPAAQGPAYVKDITLDWTAKQPLMLYVTVMKSASKLRIVLQTSQYFPSPNNDFSSVYPSIVLGEFDNVIEGQIIRIPVISLASPPYPGSQLVFGEKTCRHIWQSIFRKYDAVSCSRFLSDRRKWRTAELQIRVFHR